MEQTKQTEMNNELQDKLNHGETGQVTARAPALTALRTGIAAVLMAGATALAQDGGDESAGDLAYRVQNRLAFIPRLPIENQFDFGYGSEDAMRYALRPRPVIPFSLGDELGLITRTTMNLIYQEAPEAGLDDKFGLGDTDLELYLSPKYKQAGGWIYGAGPMLRFPTATDEVLGGEKWGAGPAVAGLRQSGRWTYGVFLNQPLQPTNPRAKGLRSPSCGRSSFGPLRLTAPSSRRPRARPCP